MIYKDECDSFVIRAERLSGPWRERVGGLRSHTDGDARILSATPSCLFLGHDSLTQRWSGQFSCQRANQGLGKPTCYTRWMATIWAALAGTGGVHRIDRHIKLICHMADSKIVE